MIIIKKIGRGPNLNLKCSKCNRAGHTIERCYEIVGYPPGWVKRGNVNNGKFAVSNNSVSENYMGFTNEQMSKLMSLISESSSSGNVQANMAGTFINCSIKFISNFHRFYNSNSSKGVVNEYMGWIIDSGASQHMTGSIKNMENLFDVSQLQMTVGHPNGTLANITKIGDLKLTNNIILKNVLVVPGYCVNLLSIHK